jgi:3-hydroxyisobutyrate dehydrogenase-like beta-hydroxyacid dehydrogenase
MTLSPTVGLLYPGEMGASVATLLGSIGVRVVTTHAGRQDRTIRLSGEAGIEPLNSLADVVRQSALVISLVETSAAVAVAQSYATLAHMAPREAIYLDANSIGPETAQAIATRIAAAGRDAVDGAFNGLAKNLAASGTLYLSGRRADEVASVFGSAVRVRVLGPEIGQASTMKMLLGGLTKGTCALFLELATLARQRNMLPEMVDACSMIYPGISALIDRMLPTYAQHSGRRLAEMRELEQTLRNSGMEPGVVAAVRELHEQLAAIAFDPSDGANVASLVQRTVSGGLLAAATGPASAEPKVA